MQSGERIVLEGREYRLGSVLSTGAGSYGQVWAAADPAGRFEIRQRRSHVSGGQ